MCTHHRSVRNFYISQSNLSFFSKEKYNFQGYFFSSQKNMNMNKRIFSYRIYFNRFNADNVVELSLGNVTRSSFNNSFIKINFILHCILLLLYYELRNIRHFQNIFFFSFASYPPHKSHPFHHS